MFKRHIPLYLLPLLLVGLCVLAPPVQAGNPSLMGAEPMTQATAHQLGAGWPGLSYAWWRAGKPDWAIGGELVYGDWAGEFSDVKIGFAGNLPMRWHLQQNGAVDVAMLIKPGALIGVGEGSDPFVFAVRGEFGIPVTFRADPKVNIITGGVAPLSILFVENVDPFVVLPILLRMGAEVQVTEVLTPWLVLEIGPALAFGDFGTEVEFAFRVMMGTTFW